ncbi:lysylphosphatidylglycerol synthase domain-containing protein [Nocardioides sp. YIM 152315]|uniref:lysylphosphatidylglycerol synthase domain-containing protein n=1 Tax=Nocardioides sp. YIM 152315 TaxID=3031760 RepID=UPI0023DC408E|nr:lysylphosphatidylglycerol synthase domain-containing protein [Nocardioides sp. YIM 152315]MDF1601981.1 lysylphosphatidylglycerol synthase domain-containing protein [Nocardioides sp. YIM 152315]
MSASPGTTTVAPRAGRRRITAGFFVAGTGSRSRRPIDVALAVVGLLVALGCARAAAHRGLLDGAVRGVADDLPRWATALFDAAYALGSVYAIGVVVAVVLTAPRRGRLPFAVLVAVGAAVGGAIVASYLAGAGLPEVDPGPVRSGSPHGFPTLRVAVVTAVLMVLRPFVVVSLRRFHVAVVGVQCVAAWAIGIAGPTDVLGALAIGIAAAGLTLVIVGSPAGHPSLHQVAATLAQLGIEVTGLRFAARQPWGARILYAAAADGRPLLVKVYGRDATDARLAARWWRTLLYRDQSAPGATRLQLVEHEALLTVLAERAGVHVDELVAAAESSGDAVLVLGAPAPSLEGRAEVDDETLRAVWDAVARLHGAGLVHGELTLAHVAMTEGQPVLSEFGSGVVAADAVERARDVAVLLSSQALVAGPERAVAAALAGIGTDAVASAQPYLQRAAMPRSLGGPGLKSVLPALSTAITERTGTPPPEPAEIVRIRWRDLLQTGLILFAAYALLTTLVELDWGTVWDTWRNATWSWVVIGLVVAQATSFADAATAMTTVRTRLPLVPLVQLQYAVKTVGLAISATLGRVALYTAFLRRFGEGPATAVTASALDSFAGAVANVVVVLVAVLLASSMPDVELSGPGNLDRIIVLFVIAVALSALAVALVARLRRHVVTAVRSAWSSLRVVTDSPTRALGLFGTNLASLMITAVAMWCMVEGLQPSLPYATVLFVTAAAALFASIIPVPGNVGVGEAAIAAGLVAVGVDSGPAFAIAVTQRLATSYLPPVYGAWALRWLRREEYID